jgi:fatty acid desaturase
MKTTVKKSNMQDKAELAAAAYKTVTATGVGTLGTMAWLNTNQPAITAVCAIVTVLLVLFFGLIRWKYEHKATEAMMNKDTKPAKEEKKTDEPVSTESVPCTPSNPCPEP